MVCTVYGLCSSKDGQVRYVGQTVKSVHRRLLKHLENARLGVKTHCYNWIREQYEQGHTVTATVLETGAEYGMAEKRWIRHYAEIGVALTNQTEGGDGTIGWKHNDVSRARMLAKRIGQKVNLSSEERARRVAQAKAIAADPAAREKMAASLRGKKLSAEAIAKRTATRRANGGYQQTEAAQAKRSASLKAYWQERKAVTP